MSSNSFEVKYQFNEEDLRLSYLENPRTKNLKKGGIVLILAGFCVIVLSLFNIVRVAWVDHEFPMSDILIFFVYLILFILGIKVLEAGNKLKLTQSIMLHREPEKFNIDLKVSEDKLIFEDNPKDNKTTIKKEYISKIINAKDFIFIQLKTNISYLIPKRALTSDQVNTLVNYIPVVKSARRKFKVKFS